MSPMTLSVAVENHEADHWFMASARLERKRAAIASDALGLPQHSRKTSRHCPAGRLERFRTDNDRGSRCRWFEVPSSQAARLTRNFNRWPTLES